MRKESQIYRIEGYQVEMKQSFSANEGNCYVR